MKISRYILSGLFAIFATCLCACDDEAAAPFKAVKNGELQQGQADCTTLFRLQDGLQDGGYSKIDFDMYNKDGQTGGKWEWFNYKEHIGLSYATPSNIIISDGKVWEHVETFSCSEGPTRYAIALSAINRSLNKKYGAYVATDFKVDEEARTVSIGKDSYNIVAANTKGIILSYTYQYLGGRTHNGGERLEIATYELAEPFAFDNEKLRFNTTAEAYDWLIDLFRDTFGEEVNLNKIYAGSVILDHPIFSVEDLIAERDRIL